ncbi:MAG: PAS domain-containing protein [Anaerolineaceae bacterium]
MKPSSPKQHCNLFRNMLEKLSPEEWEIIYVGELEIGFAFVIRGDNWKPEAQVKLTASAVELKENKNEKEIKMDELTLKVGKLSTKQVDLLLQNLPVDVTYVDENDQVAYYSQSRERIFARTPAVIGRKVQMCHPPASVHKVQKILDDFRAGTRSEAGFWIQMNGKFIHIRYFAVLDEEGIYRGTIEVTQDITEIRKLEGERRLLDD